jgi:glutamyl-tRNA synthetase
LLAFFIYLTIAEDMKQVRTRFAPSPTGYLHVGGIRTALFAWLVARQNNGRFILRLEDTDKSREVEGAEAHIIKSLETLGLDYDEGVGKENEHGPYRQSERLESYKKWAQKLIDAGRAYADPYTPEEVQAFREQAQKDKKPFLYRNHRPENPPTWDGTKPLRFKSDPKECNWHDEVLGDLHTGPEVVDDFILIKSDGYPTYNFAHIVDDAEMEISHIIRGQEFIASQPNYLNLYEALGIEAPKIATVPHILGPDGKKKLSKRDGAKDVLDYINQGFLPEALVSFIATLGWNDGTEQEIFTRNELIKKFSLDRVQRSPAKFDEKRLTWINGYLIRHMDIGELYEQVRNYWPDTAPADAFEYKTQVLKLVQERLKYFAELPELTELFFEDDVVFNKELIKSAAGSIGEPKPVLQKVLLELNKSDFSSEDLEQRLRKLVTELNAKPRDLFGLIRVTITGRMIAPGLWETLHVLSEQIGKNGVLNRLRTSIDKLEK